MIDVATVAFQGVERAVQQGGRDRRRWLRTGSLHAGSLRADGNAGKKIEQGDQTPHSAALTLTQTVYNGNQTANKTRAAESQVFGAREGLRLME